MSAESALQEGQLSLTGMLTMVALQEKKNDSCRRNFTWVSRAVTPTSTRLHNPAQSKQFGFGEDCVYMQN